MPNAIQLTDQIEFFLMIEREHGTVAGIKELRTKFHLTIVEAKSVCVRARGHESLNAYQGSLLPEIEAALTDLADRHPNK